MKGSRQKRNTGLEVYSRLPGALEQLPFDLSTLRYILAAAEFKSFRRAAEILGTYPATLSRAIRKVEDAIGVSLFERGAGGVRLTVAGQHFAYIAAAGVCKLCKAAEIAGASGRVEIGTLHVGVMTTLAGGPLRRLITSFKACHPGVAIELHDGSRWEHLANVRRRVLDIAFVVGVGKFAECATALSWRDRVHVALGRAHALAGREQLGWNDLTKEHFIVTEAEQGAETRDYIRQRLADYGVRASVDMKPVLQETLMHMVGLGDGITIVSEGWVAMPVPAIVLRPLFGADNTLPWSMVWSPKNDNPALRRFLSCARVMAAPSARAD